MDVCLMNSEWIVVHPEVGPQLRGLLPVGKHLGSRHGGSGSHALNNKKPPPSRAAVAIRKFYFLIWYTRSPASVFVDSILRPCFLAAVERKPRTLCACQAVVFIISARLAPLGRPISSRIFAPLLSARGVLASLAWAGLAFLPALASFFGAGAGALPLAFW